jgi:hypothetical protein
VVPEILCISTQAAQHGRAVVKLLGRWRYVGECMLDQQLSIRSDLEILCNLAAPAYARLGSSRQQLHVLL